MKNCKKIWFFDNVFSNFDSFFNFRSILAIFWHNSGMNGFSVNTVTVELSLLRGKTNITLIWIFKGYLFLMLNNFLKSQPFFHFINHCINYNNTIQNRLEWKEKWEDANFGKKGEGENEREDWGIEKERRAKMNREKKKKWKDKKGKGKRETGNRKLKTRNREHKTGKRKYWI